jgi:diadenosine tetraphosphate (Ap4A) HIT family hydrolase
MYSPNINSPSLLYLDLYTHHYRVSRKAVSVASKRGNDYVSIIKHGQGRVIATIRNPGSTLPSQAIALQDSQELKLRHRDRLKFCGQSKDANGNVSTHEHCFVLRMPLMYRGSRRSPAKKRRAARDMYDAHIEPVRKQLHMTDMELKHSGMETNAAGTQSQAHQPHATPSQSNDDAFGHLTLLDADTDRVVAELSLSAPIEQLLDDDDNDAVSSSGTAAAGAGAATVDDNSPSVVAGQYSIAIPVLGLERDRIDRHTATQVMLDQVHYFLSTHKHPLIRVVLATCADTTREWDRVCQPLLDQHAERVVVYNGDITALRDAGFVCWYIVNDTNWRFKCTSTGVNHRIHAACGDDFLRSRSIALHKSGQEVAKVYPVQLPLRASCPLRSQQHVRHVLQVVPPNTNANLADAIPDHEKARSLLEQCYRNIFSYFASLTGLPPPSKHAETYERNDEKLRELAPLTNPATRANPLEQVGRAKVHYTMTEPPDYSPPSMSDWPDMTGHWANALKDLMYDHKVREAVKYWEDDAVVIMYDKFPKARVHLLALPVPRASLNVEAISKLQNTSNDIAMLKSLVAHGKWVVEGMQKAHPGLTFRMGFHAIPSMRHLHMHIISQDFMSDSLKNKKHWNSFTSEFFLPPERVIEMVEQGTISDLKSGTEMHQHFKNLEKQKLSCHRCGTHIRTMPALKTHIATCTRANI